MSPVILLTLKEHDPSSVVFTWNVVLENSDWFLYLTSVLYCDGVFVMGHSSVSYWYILHLWLFRLSFSRFCGNKLACPLCVGFYKQTCRQKQVTAQKLPRVNAQQTAYLLMRTHRWCERPIQQVAYMWTVLTNWLFFTVFVNWGGFDYISLFLTKYLSGNSTNTSNQENLDKEFSDAIIWAISLNVVEIVNCCLFLRIVAKSPSFVGSSRVLKDLCRLPNFWTLILFFLHYLMGASLSIYSCSLCITQTCSYVKKSTIVKIILQITLEILNSLVMMILVVFLNHTKLRYTIPGRAYILLKGALILFCFRFFVMVVANTISLIVLPDANEGVISSKKISEILLLPFLKKTIELLWEKIFFDEKSIIGKIRRNRDTHQITFVL